MLLVVEVNRLLLAVPVLPTDDEVVLEVDGLLMVVLSVGVLADLLVESLSVELVPDDELDVLGARAYDLVIHLEFFAEVSTFKPEAHFGYLAIKGK